MRPLVSVVVPAYNAEATIAQCIEALTSLEPMPTHEIIVVDNGSTDRTPEIAATFPSVRLLHQHDVRGAAAARNVGVAAARGRILAFTDADCVPSSTWLAEGVRELGVQGVCGVAGRIVSVTPKNAVQEWMVTRQILDAGPPLRHRFAPFIQTANAFYRRTDVIAVGGFDEQLRSGEDSDLSWRILGVTGGTIAYAEGAVVAHDHRATRRSMVRQSAHNAGAGPHLARVWGTPFRSKGWKTSVWEVSDLMRSGFAAILARTGSDRVGRDMAELDFLHRLGRKCGMFAAAGRTGVWSEW